MISQKQFLIYFKLVMFILFMGSLITLFNIFILNKDIKEKHNEWLNSLSNIFVIEHKKTYADLVIDDLTKSIEESKNNLNKTTQNNLDFSNEINKIKEEASEAKVQIQKEIESIEIERLNTMNKLNLMLSNLKENSINNIQKCDDNSVNVKDKCEKINSYEDLTNIMKNDNLKK